MAAKSPRRARPGRARARLSRISALGLLAAGGALAGCGAASPTAASPTAASSSARPLEVSSPAFPDSRSIPARYTCAGKNISPPLHWGKIPSHTTELALFLLDLGHTEPAGGGAARATVTVGWALRGLKPTLRGIAAGKIPPGAIAGHGRYSICPPRRGTGEYMFRLYALSSRLPVKRGLDDLELFRRINRASTAVGYVITSYTRS